MCGTRTVLARILCSVTAAVALTASCAGLAAANELPATTAPYTPTDEVPWTALAPEDEVPWTGPVPGLVGAFVGFVTDLIGDGEVPWT
ncbi:hypothetical protein OG361_31260 [Streptomyces sp. NBC_00090]|uniref:hypothetical protein n=1 Tax=Streptomyces sp. NBC_00090 TaxID=2903619 RepID=UPI00324D88EC